MSSTKDLVSASLDVQGVPATEKRVSEIAIEAERLMTGLSAHLPRLSYNDEPSQFAVLLMSEKTDG